MGNKRKKKAVKKLGSLVPPQRRRGWGGPKLQLEVGKRYYRRDGAITEPLVTKLGDLYDPLGGWYYDKHGGLVGALYGSKHDLVAECKHPGCSGDVPEKLLKDMLEAEPMPKGSLTIEDIASSDAPKPAPTVQLNLRLNERYHDGSRATYDAPGDLTSVVSAVVSEYLAAKRWPAMNSAHEGWGILREEMLELEDELRLNQKFPKRPARIKKEAIQVAAMAIRLILDCCEEGSPGYGK